MMKHVVNSTEHVRSFYLVLTMSVQCKKEVFPLSQEGLGKKLGIAIHKAGLFSNKSQIFSVSTGGEGLCMRCM